MKENRTVHEWCGLEHIDLETDLALLKLEPLGDALSKIFAQREARVRPVRTWMPVQLGERVYAFGFPLRPVLSHTLNMAEGIVSAETGLRKDRFQFSAPIQKGNSGGPVYDQRGNLIGVVTSKLSPVGDAIPENVNFAIRTHPLLEICHSFRDRLNTQECHETYPPIVLGKLMQQLCVEVECWEKTPHSS